MYIHIYIYIPIHVYIYIYTITYDCTPEINTSEISQVRVVIAVGGVAVTVVG